MRDFASSAVGLTKNPLGIIGLFIVLVYGFACLVLGFGAANLEADDKRIIVLFIVLFPAAILAVFFRLVTTHHKKLYAPSDYKDERLFLEPQTDERRSERLDSEVARVEQQESVAPPPLQLPTPTPTSAAVSPPAQAPRPTRLIRSTYADAERLAFLELEKEIGKPFQKYIQVSSHGRKEEFDGVLVTEQEAHLVEVKYFSRPEFKREFLEALIHRASTFMWDQTVDDKSMKETVIFWIAIVVDFPQSELAEFKKKVEAAVRCDMFKVNLRFYRFTDMKTRYG